MSLWFFIPFILAAFLPQTVYMQGTGNTAADCCLLTSDKRIPFSVIAGYEIQSVDRGCSTAAVVFFIKNSKILCATPGLKWVKNAMKKLDQMQKKKVKVDKVKGGKKPHGNSKDSAASNKSSKAL
ncbi:eotaxin-like isoform X2 [Pelobates fuscus]|uniref:eotaxin-like isoform X2 n=1 Tax=Pelobates fuscus TaxID=191477 RepID=UPI002FE42CAE